MMLSYATEKRKPFRMKIINWMQIIKNSTQTTKVSNLNFEPIDSQIDFTLHAVSNAIVGHAHVRASVSSVKLNDLKITAGCENESTVICLELLHHRN